MPAGELARGQVLYPVRCRPQGLSFLQLLISESLTAAFIIIPIILVLSIEVTEQEASESFGTTYVGVFVIVALLMAVFAAVMGIVSGVLRQRNHSVGSSVKLAVPEVSPESTVSVRSLTVS